MVGGFQKFARLLDAQIQAADTTMQTGLYEVKHRQVILLQDYQ